MGLSWDCMIGEIPICSTNAVVLIAYIWLTRFLSPYFRIKIYNI